MLEVSEAKEVAGFLDTHQPRGHAALGYAQ